MAGADIEVEALYALAGRPFPREVWGQQHPTTSELTALRQRLDGALQEATARFREQGLPS